MTEYGQLLQSAHTHLTVAAARPLKTEPASAPAPTAVVDLVRALTQLADTVGMTPDADLRRGPDKQRVYLMAALRRGSAIDTAPAARAVTPVDVDLRAATVAVRTAADLLASRGPLPNRLTDRYLAHSEWTAPRSMLLHSSDALAGAWSQIAVLADTAGRIAQRTEDPDLADAGRQWALAAGHITPADPDPLLERALPGRALPLTHRVRAGEWDARLQELAAIAWRFGSPDAPEQAGGHPVAALRYITDIGHGIHMKSAAMASNREQANALRQRGKLWEQISVCVHSINTPMDHLTAARRASLGRTRALIEIGHLDSHQLFQGRATLSVAATHLSEGIAEHYEGNPKVTIGPRISSEALRNSRLIKLAHLNRVAIVIPDNALRGLVGLLANAAAPIPVVRLGAERAAAAQPPMRRPAPRAHAGSHL